MTQFDIVVDTTQRQSAKRALLSMALGLATLATACLNPSQSSNSGTPSAAAGGTASPKSVAGGVLNMRLFGDFDVLDPSGSKAPSAASQEIIMGLYDRLVGYGPKGELVPYLAKSWKRPDSATVSFELRSDAKCQDGAALTPTAVASSFSRLFKDAPASVQAQAFGAGAGAPAITPNDATNTVEFKWPRPSADAIYGFQTPYASVICPSGLANLGQLQDRPSGSGPYSLSSALRGDSAKIVKNPVWKWGPSGLTAADLPDSITFRVITSDTTAANQLLTGEVDLGQISGIDVDRLMTNPSLRPTKVTSFKLAQLFMNATAGHPTSDPQIRRAIMTAINSEDWNRAAFSGYGLTGTSLFLKDAQCYEPETAKVMPTYSQATAKEILATAGYLAGPDGKLAKAGKPLTLTLVGAPIFGHGTEYIAAQLTSIGITVKLEEVDVVTWSSRLQAGNFDLTTFTIASPDVPSSQIGFVAGPIPPAGGNWSYYVDPTADANLQAALNANEADRCKAWSALQLQLLKNFDMLPLATVVRFIFAKPTITFALAATLVDTATLRRTQ